MAKNFLDLKTDPSLLCALHGASQHKQTAAEMLEQRVSFVYGSVSSNNGVTREQVRKLILEQEGVEGETR
ncbi:MULTISPECIES: hypothetical protein [Pseudomonas]|uniref:Uncharacterized protein n=1 Tax=Pseudomonas chlororaphis TaxID=587753 RepID=A0AAP9VSS2_9PSED|nr:MULTISPECIES: hypothetical protein [Pseudomonas]PCR93240.1 hypothetical protein CP336_27380 [Pseudomonas fluorescens]QNR46940.1 hypothetical protein HLB40_25285 [Pseudomonas chlororaphis]